MNLLNKRLAALLMMEFMIFFPVYMVQAVKIDNITTEVDGKMAKITFSTSTDANSTIIYQNKSHDQQYKYINEKRRFHEYIFDELNENSQYYVEIRAVEENGDWGREFTNFVTGDSSPPGKVTGLAVSEITDISAKLSWTAPSDEDIKTYLIFRDGDNIANSTEISYIDSTLVPSTKYVYQVTPIDFGGNLADASVRVEFSTLPPDTTAPKISEIKLTGVSHNSFTVAWKTDEMSDSVVYYGIGTLDKVKGDSKKTLEHIATVSNLEIEKTYNYVISSCDMKDNCVNSSMGSVTPGSDYTPPQFTAELPEFTNKEEIDIFGSTEALAEIKVFVNGFWRKTEKAELDGTFRISGVKLDTRTIENTVALNVSDEAGNTATKSYKVKVDVKAPDVKFNGFPKISKGNSISINGTVDDNVTLRIYSVAAQNVDNEPPGQVTNLTSVNTSATNVMLRWAGVEDRDLEGYAIYRNNLRIAVVRSNSFNDVVNPGNTYRYRIAAYDRNCNEGKLSATSQIVMPASTLSGSMSQRQVEMTCTNKKPQNEIGLDAGEFNEVINLMQGINYITLQFIDQGGNTVEFKGTVIHDTKPPTIMRNNIAELNPSYTKEVTITGKVDEKAIVSVYVNDDDEPYITTTDEEGNFAVDVQLRRQATVTFSENHPANQNSRTTYIHTDNYNTSSITLTTDDGYTNIITVRATDAVGLESQVVQGKITYTMCGQGSWYTLNIDGIYPDTLNPRIINEGQGQIGFAVRLDYAGNDKEKSKLKKAPGVTIRPLSVEDRNNWDEDWVRVGSQFDQKNDFTDGYVYIMISPQQQRNNPRDNTTQADILRNISEHRMWEAGDERQTGQCLVPEFGCVRIPLIIDMEFFDETYNVMQRQKNCIDVEVKIDRILFDASDIPKGFLEDAVVFLNDTINVIDKVLKPINDVKKIVFYLCIASWAALYIKGLQKRWTCEYSSTLEKLSGAGFKVEVAETGQCEKVYKESSDSLDSCKSCEDAVRSYQNFEFYMKSICDRIFCPKVPSFQKYVTDMKKEKGMKTVVKLNRNSSDINPTIINASDSAAAAANQDPANTDPAIAIDTSSDCSKNININYEGIKEVYDVWKEQKEDGNTCKELHPSDPKCCGYEYMRQWDSGCGLPGGILFNELKQSACVAKKFSQASDDDLGCDNFGNKLWNSIAGFCENKGKPKPGLVDSHIPFKYDQEKYKKHLESDTLFEQEEFKPPTEFKPEGTAKEDKGITYYNIYNDNDTSQQFNFQGQGNICSIGTFDGISMRPGDEKNIWYRIVTPEKDGDQFHVHMGAITKNVELADTGTEDLLLDADQPSRVNANLVFYPLSQDISEWFTTDKVDSSQVEKKYAENNIYNVQGFKAFQLQLTQCSSMKIGEPAAMKIYKDIQASIGVVELEYIVDPTSGFLRSVQCICLPGITSYLALWKAILEAVMMCFQTILVTGDGSPGICRQVLTVYVCDLIYDFIRCFTQRFSSGGDRKYEGGIGGIFSTLTSAGDDVQKSVSSRYGSTSLFKSMFSERKVVHAICLFAFTGTWDMDIDAFLEADAGFPIDSQGFLYPCKRRFISFNPTGEGLTTWTYELGVGLIAGADLQYRVDLICSDGYECNYDGAGDEKCDCSDTGERKRAVPLKSARVLKKHDTVQTDELITLQEEKYRYDKAILTYTYTDNSNQRVNKEITCKISPVGGQPPAHCSFDVGSGYYSCGYETGNEDSIKFTSVSPQFSGILKPGKYPKYTVGVQQNIPKNKNCAYGNCEFTKYLGIVIKNEQGGVVYSSATDKNSDGFIEMNSEGANIYTAPLNYKIEIADFLSTGGDTRSSCERPGNFVESDCIGLPEGKAMMAKKSGEEILCTVVDINMTSNKESTANMPCTKLQNSTYRCSDTTIKVLKEIPAETIVILTKPKKATAEAANTGVIKCPDKPKAETWSITFTIYESVATGGESTESSTYQRSYQPVEYDDKPVIWPESFEVICDPDYLPGSQTTSTAQSDEEGYVDDFKIEGKSFPGSLFVDKSKDMTVIISSTKETERFEIRTYKEDPTEDDTFSSSITDTLLITEGIKKKGDGSEVSADISLRSPDHIFKTGLYKLHPGAIRGGQFKAKDKTATIFVYSEKCSGNDAENTGCFEKYFDDKCPSRFLNKTSSGSCGDGFICCAKI